MPAPITKHLKHLSILDLNRLYATEEQQIEFFFYLKWPEGFICPKGAHIHSTYYAAHHIYECTKLPLFTWILMIYFICDSTNGISATELSRKVGISVKSATMNARKIKFATMQRNEQYQLFGCAEHDEIYIGAPSKNGKRGLGTDKQLVYTQVRIENNQYPTFVKFTMKEKSTTQAIVEALTKNIKPDSTLITDGNRSYVGLEPIYRVNTQKNDYINHPEHLRWLNIIVSKENWYR